MGATGAVGSIGLTTVGLTTVGLTTVALATAGPTAAVPMEVVPMEVVPIEAAAGPAKTSATAKASAPAIEIDRARTAHR